MPDEVTQVVNNQTIDALDAALEQGVLAELSALPLVQPSAQLDEQIERVLEQAAAAEKSDGAKASAGWLLLPSRRSWSMAAMLILAAGLGVVVGTKLPGGERPTVDPGLQAVASDLTGTGKQDARSGVAIFPEDDPRPGVAGVGPLPGGGYRWEREPQSEWILSESAPVSSVVTDEAGEPKRAWGTQGVRRSVYVDQDNNAQIELIQPEQSVIWVSQPVY